MYEALPVAVEYNGVGPGFGRMEPIGWREDIAHKPGNSTGGCGYYTVNRSAGRFALFRNDAGNAAFAGGKPDTFQFSSSGSDGSPSSRKPPSTATIDAARRRCIVCFRFSRPLFSGHSYKMTSLSRSGLEAMVQFFLELEPNIPDLYFESSAFADAGTYLDSIADKLKIKSVYEFFSYAGQDDLCPPGYEETDVPWFDPQEGIDWINAVIAHLRATPSAVEDTEQLVGDLTNCKRVLHKAQAAGAKWHLAN